MAFSNISATEVDAGTVNSFVNSAGLSLRAGNVPTIFSAGYQGLAWSAFSSGALAPGSSSTITISYDLTDTAAGMGINGLQQAMTIDTNIGTGVSLSAVEFIYDSNNNLVGQQTINQATPSTVAPVAVGDFGPTAAFTSLHVVVVVTAAVAADAVVPSAINFSIIDQGFHQTALADQAGLGDTVWDDANKDGIQDNGETGVSGVSVALLDANGHATGLTTTTDANGHYSFDHLNVGTYQVQFAPPPDYTFTATGQGTAATDSNANQTTGRTGPIVLTAGQYDNTIDAGLVAPGTHDTTNAALGDYVFADANANGIQDAGESGISGVTVKLLDGSGNPTGQTTTTDSTGHYAFTNLMAGTYEVSFTAPSTYNFSPTGQGTPATDSNPGQIAGSVGTTGPITLAIGQVDNTIDAGLYQRAALGDYVFDDKNGNGIQDAGDSGVSGVTVNLLDSNGNPTGQTTTTDSAGHYGFSSLIPGVYEVQFVAPTGATFSPTGQGTAATDSNPNTGNGTTGPVTLVSGQTDNTIDAGLILPPPTPPPGTAQLGDRVWYDCNANGIQNSGESGVAHVTVNLLDATGTTVLATTTTDSQGHYGFSSLNAGVYQVQFIAPTDRSFTAALQGSNRGADSNADTISGVTGPITLAAGQIDLTIDAGLIKAPTTAKLGDLVFQDCNGNGIQDAGESGVSCVTVKLLSSSGSVLRTTTTDSSGHYLFNNIAAGTYTVQFVAPGGMKFTTALQGGNTAIDSNPNAAGKTASITLAAGQSDLTIDAGLYKPASLGNMVFYDANGNGVQDGCEGGVSGVTVNLLDGTGSNVLGTTTTDSSGHYGFANLMPGVYEVQFLAPSGKTFTTQMAGHNTSIDSNPDASTGITGPITLACGQCDTSIDAGLIQSPSPNTARLGDFVFRDSNHNGIQDQGESGIGGVTVKLLNASGNSVLSSTTTNSSGQYQFSSLAAGSYMVQFVTPGSYTLSPALRGSDIAKDSNAGISTGKTGVINLAAGQTNLTIDAGMYQNGSCDGGGHSGDDDDDHHHNGGGHSGDDDDDHHHSGGSQSGDDDDDHHHSGGSHSGDDDDHHQSGGGNSCSSDDDHHNSGGNNSGDDDGHHQNGGGNSCDTVDQDALSCGVGSSGGHNSPSPCFIQITDKSGDHSAGANIFYHGDITEDCKVETSGDLTKCGGQLYAHIFASHADYDAGHNAIQDVSFNGSGSHDVYFSQQSGGGLCLTSHTGSHGTAYTNW